MMKAVVLRNVQYDLIDITSFPVVIF